MFDTVISTIAIQANLNLSINSRLNTEIEIKRDGELPKEVWFEWYTMYIAKSFHKRVHCDIGAAVVCQAKELKGSDGDCGCRGVQGTRH